MAYELFWVVEKRVLMARFHGSINAEGIQAFIAEQHAMIAEGIPLVHHINDTTDTGKIEVNLQTMQALMKSFKMPAGLGWHIEVNPNPVNRMVSGIALQFAKARYRVVPTVDEAIAFLQANDESLPQLVNPYSIAH